MEINYNLPLKLECLALKQRQSGNGLEKFIESFDVYVLWDDIVTMEEFINHEEFPEDENEKPKVTIVTKLRAYVMRADINITSQMWGAFKLWKSKQVIKPLFSIN